MITTVSDILGWWRFQNKTSLWDDTASFHCEIDEWKRGRDDHQHWFSPSEWVEVWLPQTRAQSDEPHLLVCVVSDICSAVVANRILHLGLRSTPAYIPPWYCYYLREVIECLLWDFSLVFSLQHIINILSGWSFASHNFHPLLSSTFLLYYVFLTEAKASRVHSGSGDANTWWAGTQKRAFTLSAGNESRRRQANNKC